MGLCRSHREHMHAVHQKIYGKSNSWVGKAMKPEKKTTLHKELKIPDNKKIPEKPLKKLEKTKDISVKRKENLIKTLKTIDKKKK